MARPIEVCCLICTGRGRNAIYVASGGLANHRARAHGIRSGPRPYRPNHDYWNAAQRRALRALEGFRALFSDPILAREGVASIRRWLLASVASEPFLVGVGG